jgi:nucleoside-diphosphate-sugar epimerase
MRSGFIRRVIMKYHVLVTGSSGLIGCALSAALEAQGIQVRRLDLRAQGADQGDVCDKERLAHAFSGVDGVIHLAAVSRVIWGEQDPERCWAVNVGSVRHVLELTATQPTRPWVIFASSREVYGQPDSLPAAEDTPLRPVNIYGRSKVEGERLIVEAREAGLRACTIRLSNVFGSIADHADRVVPAFAAAAVAGRDLRIDGAGHTFDFTYVEDVARGICALVDLLRRGEPAPPPIHFVTGQPTTLGELAEAAVRLADSSSVLCQAPPRSFDVARFWGDPARAHALLGWRASVSLEQGLIRLIQAFREAKAAERSEEVAP